MKYCKVKAAGSQFQNSFSLQTEIGEVKKQSTHQKGKTNGGDMEGKGYFHRSTKHSLVYEI